MGSVNFNTNIGLVYQPSSRLDNDMNPDSYRKDMNISIPELNLDTELGNIDLPQPYMTSFEGSSIKIKEAE